MPEFEVKSPIKYGGKRREVGEPVEIKEPRVAKALLAAGAIGQPTVRPRAPSDQDLLALLDQPIPKIIEAISQRDSEGNPRAPLGDLQRLRKAEENGKTRKTLIDAIDAEIAARQAPPQS